MVNHEQLTISPVVIIHPNEYFRPLLIIITMYKELFFIFSVKNYHFSFVTCIFSLILMAITVYRIAKIKLSISLNDFLS